MSEPRVLIDLSHTAHTRARTGIQRVARALLEHVPAASPVTFDRFQGVWRPLEPWEMATLAANEPAGARGAKWPLTARLRGRFRALTSRPAPILAADALIVPELFSPHVARAYPLLFTQVSGPKIALFHDAIALQLPGSAPAKTVTRFPSYLKELLAFDGIAAISAASRETLEGYWRWLGVENPPPVRAIPLGTQPAPPSGGTPLDPPQVLYVSSLEGRKNHVALLEACELLWARGERFSLRLIGLAHPQSGRPALERIEALKAAGRPLIYDGAVTEADLEKAYRDCAFTVYPSLLEGFGLPVIESVSRGKPCLCSARGALGETARSGGCLVLSDLGAPSLAEGIARLLRHPDVLSSLVLEASARTDKTWSTYGREVAAWAKILRPRTEGR